MICPFEWGEAPCVFAFAFTFVEGSRTFLLQGFHETVQWSLETVRSRDLVKSREVNVLYFLSWTFQLRRLSFLVFHPYLIPAYELWQCLQNSMPEAIDGKVSSGCLKTATGPSIDIDILVANVPPPSFIYRRGVRRQVWWLQKWRPQ